MTHQDILTQAIEAGKEMNHFLALENTALEARQIEQVEAGLSRKTRLAGKMEKAFQLLHDQQENLAADRALASIWRQLTNVVEDYRHLVKANRLLLEAAHASTADFLAAIKQTLEAEKPKTNVYGASGQMSHKPGGSVSLVNKAV